MPLVNCPACSTQLKIPDGMGGKKARCTKCQNVFTIAPELGAAAPPLAPPQMAPPPPPMAPAPMMSPPRPMPGPAPSGPQQHIQRPGGPPMAPGNQMRVAPQPGQRPPARGPAGMPPRRPVAAPQKGRGMMIAIIALVGILVLAGGGVGAYFLFFRGTGNTNNPNAGGDPTADHKWLPDDPQIIVSLRIGDFFASPALSEVAKQVPDVKTILEHKSGGKKGLGVDPDDIDSALFGMSKNRTAGMFMRTKKDYTSDMILENLGKKGQETKSTEGAYTIYQVGLSDCFCVAESRAILLYEKIETLRDVLKRNGPPNLSSNIKTGINNIDFRSTLAVVVDPAFIMSSMMGGPGGIKPGGPGGFKPGPGGGIKGGPQFDLPNNPRQLPPEFPGGPGGPGVIPGPGGPGGGFPGPGGPGGIPGMDTPPTPDNAAFEVNVTDKVNVKAVATFKDEDSAKKAETFAKTTLPLLMGFVPGVPKEASDLVGKINYTVSGPKLTGQLTVETSVIVATLNSPAIAPQLAKAAKELKGGGETITPPDQPAVNITLFPYQGVERTLAPKQSTNYTFFTKANKEYTVEIKGPSALSLGFTVTANGAKIPTNLDIQAGARLEKWTSKGSDNIVVRLTNQDPTANKFVVSVTEKDATTAAVDPPVVTVSTWPYTNFVFAEGGQTLTYEFAGKPGKEYKLTLSGTGAEKASIRVTTKTGAGVPGASAAPEPGKNNRESKWTSTATDTYVIKLKNTDTAKRDLTIGLYESDGGPAVIKKDGPFNDSRKFNSSDKTVYEFPVQANQPAEVIVKVVGGGASSADLKVTQNGATVGSDSGFKGEWKVAFTPTVAGTYQAEVKPNVAVAVNLIVEFKQGPGPVAKVEKKATPSVAPLLLNPKANLIYEFMVEKGKSYNFSIKFAGPAAKIDLKATQNGNVVATDTGTKNDFAMKITPQVDGPVQVAINNGDSLVNSLYEFSVDAGVPVVGPPPVPVEKPGPFVDNLNMPANGQAAFNIPVQPGPATFSLTAPQDSNLLVKVIQLDNGLVVAQDVGLKKAFLLNWNALAAAKYQVLVQNLGNTPVLPAVAFNQTPAPPVIPGAIVKNGPFTEKLQIKKGNSVTYTFPVGAGAGTFTFKPIIDGKLDIKVSVNGQMVAQDLNGPIKTKFDLAWNAPAPGQAVVEIQNKDTIEVGGTATYAGAGGVVPPPPAGGMVLDTKSNVAAGNQTSHQVNLEAGKKYVIRLKTLTNGYDPYLWLHSPTGELLAKDDDGDGYPNAKIVWTAQVSGLYTIKCGSFNNSSGGNYALTVQDAGAVAPVLANITLPFHEARDMKPGDQFTFNFNVTTDQTYTVDIKPNIPAKFDVRILEGKTVVVQDVGGAIKPNHVLSFIPVKNGVVTVSVHYTDTIQVKSDISITQGGGGGGGPVVDYTKNGNLSKVSKSYTHTMQLQAGVKYTISGTANGFFLHLEVKDGGQTLKDGSFPTGNGSITFTPTVTKNYQVIIRDVFNDKTGSYSLSVSH